MKKYTNIKQFLNVKKITSWMIVSPFIDHLFDKVNYHISKWWRVLILTLTKKSSEDISNFFIARWYKAFYLHSEIDTINRWEIINKLKNWQIDVLVWVNLLREWIDLPQVSLIAILDADKEWFLRSTTSLIQIIWRAARNPNSEVVLYADSFTNSIIKSLFETYRRRNTQNNFNIENNISPQKAISNVKTLDVVKTDKDLDLSTIWSSKLGNTKKLRRMTKKEKEIIALDLKTRLDEHIRNWEFEQAAIIRDQLKDLEWD